MHSVYGIHIEWVATYSFPIEVPLHTGSVNLLQDVNILLHKLK